VSEGQEVKSCAKRTRLKKLVADLSLGQGRAAIGHPKKLTELAVKKAEVRRLMAEFASSEWYACEFLSILRSTCRYAGMVVGAGMMDYVND
jgi:hypothetical protein